MAIEIDRDLVDRLRADFAGDARLEVVHADVLKTDLSQWGHGVLAGNLPYYITSPILERVFQASGIISRATLLVQKEVALRISCGPGTRDYGYLSVLTRAFAEPELLFSVPAAAFRPPPKVASAVVSLRMRPPEPRTAAFLEFASLCFRQKRKTLRNNLFPRYPKTLLDAMPEAPLRAEQLSIDQLRGLHQRLENASTPPLLS